MGSYGEPGREDNLNTHNTLVVIMTKSSRSITENNESVATKKTLFQRVGDFLESKV
jgi:hypothetical protein